MVTGVVFYRIKVCIGHEACLVYGFKLLLQVGYILFMFLYEVDGLVCPHRCRIRLFHHLFYLRC